INLLSSGTTIKSISFCSAYLAISSTAYAYASQFAISGVISLNSTPSIGQSCTIATCSFKFIMLLPLCFPVLHASMAKTMILIHYSLNNIACVQSHFVVIEIDKFVICLMLFFPRPDLYTLNHFLHG